MSDTLDYEGIAKGRDIVELRTRDAYEGSLFSFVKDAWPWIDSAEFKSCWAIEAFCLPYNTAIITDEGNKFIGDIVASKWNGCVLSYNCTTGVSEWKQIARWMKSPHSEFVRICHPAGELTVTDNHPVYVIGRGCIRADEVKVGDAIVRALRSSGKEADGSVLQSHMLREGEGSTRSSDVPKVRWPQVVGRSILSFLSKLGAALGRGVSLPDMRFDGLSLSCAACSGAEELWSVLQPQMHRNFSTWQKKSSLRQRTTWLLSRYLLADTKGHQASRWVSMLPVRSSKETLGCSPHQSTKNNKQAVELGDAMSQVSRQPAPSSDRSQTGYEVSATTVTYVERQVRISEAVYNIEVVDNHNYFAESVLVHNCDHLELVTFGYIKRLLVNYPPRCSKTNIVSVCWPAWTWARSQINFTSGPQVRFLCASYNDRLSLLAANKTRRLLLSPFYQRFWGSRFSLQWDQNTKTQFDNTQGGSRIATSVRGGLLGLGGDIIDVDDPHNTETERVVESDADRNRVSSWSQELFSTRLNDPKKSAIVLTMQRLHEGDLSGVVLDEAEKSGEDWVHLMIPMRYDESRHCVTVKLPQYEGEPVWEDPRGEIAAEVGIDGQLMWEERFGEAEVVNLEQRLGPYMAAGRLQQRPTPKGGGILMRDWWKPWDEHEAMRYGLTWSESLKEFPHFELVWGSLDTAYKEKEENDFNALTIWGLWMDQTKTPRLMLMYAWAKRLKLHGPVIEQKPGEAAINYKQRQQAQWGLIEWIGDTMKRYKAQRLLIEDKARGYDVASEINRLYAREKWGVQLLEPVGDKVSRGHAVVPCFTDGAIWAPFLKGYPIVWAEAVIKNCEVFPKATHDDLYDTVTQSVNWARENGLILRGDEVSAALDEEATYKPRQQSVAEHYGV